MSLENFNHFIIGWILLAVLVFVLLLFITAPYGRHTKTNWGPLVSNRAGWVVMEIFALVFLYFFVFIGKINQSLVNGIILFLFTFHYVNRSLIFPFRIKSKGKKMPLVIMLMGLTFNLVNGFIIGYYLGNFRSYKQAWLTSPQFIIGTAIFIIGLIINWQADNKLIHLRRPGESGYKIPSGGLFKFISAPNLFGEIIEWLGYAILMWSLPGTAFFIWSAANLIPRALAHHKWYLNKFPDYPKNRKAVIPGIV